MRDGMMPVVVLIAAFIVGESVIPRLLSLLWRHLSVHFGKTAHTPESVPDTQESKSGSTVPIQSADCSESVESSSPVENPSSSSLPSSVSTLRTASAVQEPHTSADVDSKRLPTAERLWHEARLLPHRFIPDLEHDAAYLEKLCAAAKLGHIPSMLKLGDYAVRRGAIVEAYYWMSLADLRGAAGLEMTLRNMRFNWRARGYPEQRGNVYAGFSEQQGDFARALLRIRDAVNPDESRARMRELSESGCVEAQLFLEKENAAAGRRSTVA